MWDLWWQPSNLSMRSKESKTSTWKTYDLGSQWCNFHQKWGNHNTNNCVEQVKHARAQAIKDATYVEPKVAPMID